MFEVDLRNGGHCVSIGVQQDNFPAPVPSRKAIFALQSPGKFLLQAPGAVYICNGGRKVDSKGTSTGQIY